jgi:hypothetical protein
MQSSQFIFSNKYRLRRHLLFWFCWWMFCTIIYAYTPAVIMIPIEVRFISSGIDATMFLVPHMFLSYSLMYFVVPRLVLKRKYVLAVIAVVCLFLITGTISAALGLYFLDEFKAWLFPSSKYMVYHAPNHFAFYLAVLAGLRGAITIGGLAASIKIMKHLSIKEQRNLQLQKENMQSQLQVLKAQVHPHFLFNTLNNIYSHTQNTSPVASQLVMGLSDMLRYMLYEGNEPLVALSKEVNMLENYILVEQIRYGNKLDVHFDVPTDLNDLAIAPLLLLPFVENSFKHGASQVIDQPWVSVSITITDKNMLFKTVNGKPENYHPHSDASGIGIQNVQRRLELLYPGKHVLKIKDEDEVFVVDLKMELERKPIQAKQVKPLTKRTVYE